MGRLYRRLIRGTDLFYLLLCLTCAGLSVAVLASWCMFMQNNTDGQVNYKVAIVQAAAAGLGLVCAVILSYIDYHLIARLWPLHAAASWLLVAATFVWGYSPLDTTNKAWLRLPAGLSLQPSELAKISFIITFALHLSTVKEELNRPRCLLPVLAHLLAPALIIHLQGDDGSMLVFVAVGLCMLFAAGLNWKYIVGGMLAVGVVSPFLWSRMEGYQQERVIALFHQEDPAYAKILYQQICGKISIGAGQTTGRGLFSGEHHYVPLAYNDFFFSYLSECLGFIGSIGVLLLLGAVCTRTLHTALRAQDELGSYICIGIFGVLLAQTVINIGMNLSLLPVIGVTLPFFSGGGTSMVMLFLCVGLVLSVYRVHPRELFDRQD